METRILTTSKDDIKAAAGIIRAGGLVAFPTETVYGLGANAMNAAAVKRVYQVKGRPGDNPMIVHIARASDIGQLTPLLNQTMITLIDNFWPGPLTLVVEKKPGVPGVTTGGLETVAVRMPDEAAALELIRESGQPIAAPSANLSGRPSPTKAAHVIDDLSGRVEAILAGGDCRVGIESTVLDVTAEVPVILRPGVVTAEDISAALGSPVGHGGDESAPKSPGMKYKHYAPRASMTVIEGQRGKVESEVARIKELNEALGNRVGVMLFEERAFREAAHDFFARLRELDDEGADLILAGALSDTDGVGFAVMNRMLRSAGYNVVKV